MAVKKVPAPPTQTAAKRAEIMELILNNMKVQQQRLGRTGILLAGDPGVGKTSLVRQLARLLGMELLLIEAPHVTEEHLINIPFIIFKQNGSTEHGKTLIDPNNYDVKLSTSNLATKLRNLPKITDEQTLQHINVDPMLKKLHQQLGGSEDALAPDIQEVRENFKGLLFLDEYFRQTSGNVRNILRDILNNNIGMDKVPKGTYVIYASNMKDEGLDEITGNTEFAKKVTIGTPHKDDWFEWLEADAKKHGMPIKPEVLKAFQDKMEQHHLNHQDKNELRISPRRWEQIMHYVSAALPVKDAHESSQLITNLHHMVREDEAVHELEPMIMNVVRGLIRQTSNADHASADRLPDSEWRDTLEHQIKMKMRIGDKRTYIPLLSGPPGVGKTSAAADIAKKLNLVYVPINAMTLAAEDVIGLPIPGKEDSPEAKEGDIAVRFSDPKLYMKIMRSIKEGEDDMMRNPGEYGMTPDEAKAWKNRKAKYLIFFDELNRVKSAKEYNALRQVILEKKVGEKKLPKEAIIMAALNPQDKRTIQMTSHMRDVTDVLPTAPSWAKLKDYLEKLEFSKLKNPTVKQVALEVIKDFAEEFSHKKMQDDIAKFHLKSGDENVYVSQREYESMFTNLVVALDKAYSKVDPADYDDEDKYREAVKKEFRKVIHKEMHGVLSFIFEDKHAQDNPEFMEELTNWINDLDLDKSFKKKVKVTGLQEILQKHLDNPDLDMAKDLAFSNYIQNNFDYVVFKEDLMKFFNKELTKDATKFVTHQHLPKKVMDKGAISKLKEKVSALEHLVREMVHSIRVFKLDDSVRSQIVNGVHEAFMHAATKDDIDNDKFLDVLGIKQSLDQFLRGNAQ